MIPYLTPGLWWAVNNGNSKRAWFLFRPGSDFEHRYRCDVRGRSIRYASYKNAQRVADQLNAAEAS